MTNQSPQLDYAPPLPWRQRRRVRRWIVVAIVFGFAVSSLWWGPPVWRNAKSAYWMDRCRRYTARVDQVIYDDDPPASAAHAGFVGEIPKCWAGFLGRIATPQMGFNHPLFLHDRTSTQLRDRLISVWFTGWYHGPWLEFQAITYRPGGDTEWSIPVGIRAIEPGSLRIFAGQPDPVDLSHFTIGYESGGQKGTIDGWLKDDESVKMEVRDGPAKK